MIDELNTLNLGPGTKSSAEAIGRRRSAAGGGWIERLWVRIGIELPAVEEGSHGTLSGLPVTGTLLWNGAAPC